MRTPGIEIERKYRLAAAPAPAVLAAHGAEAWRFEQVYLLRVAGSDARRVRRSVRADGRVFLVLTEKAGLGAGTIARREVEREITAAEYEALLGEADPTCRPVRKTRHVVVYGEQVLEIDVFVDPPGLVVVEVELVSEDEPVELPAWLGTWVEVTDDPRYLNARLARHGAVVPPWPEAAGR